MTFFDLDLLPAPRPLYEIFVYAPEVEGVHLRFGKIARGGIRWSDRPQDFRTEVLGLVKAQQVKNAVIVPVGYEAELMASKSAKVDYVAKTDESTIALRNTIASAVAGQGALLRAAAFAVSMRVVQTALTSYKSVSALSAGKCARIANRSRPSGLLLMLAPTTILAQQHWTTFRDRFAPYPVRVEMLSRFRTPREQKAVLAGLHNGTVDVVIGTHRLLTTNVRFKDLGLVVIDEEQRFGVEHKEHLKALRTNVDVLTMSATPIPRTMQFSMLGARDISIVSTPPKNRQPVETVPRLPEPGWPTDGAPDADEPVNMFWPARRRPPGLRKVARAIWPSFWMPSAAMKLTPASVS